MQPADATGIVEEMRERRDCIERSLSKQAFGRAFPTLAKPVPYQATMSRELRDEITALKAQVAGLEAALEAEREKNRALQEEMGESERRIKPMRQPPADVIRQFLDALNERSGNDPMTAGDLQSPRRARWISAPRHVCMHLVRRLCTQLSLPQIGKLFGARDHTSVMHALRRAPHWMECDPVLRETADAVLARFGVDESRGRE